MPLGFKIFKNFREKDNKISVLQVFIVSLMKNVDSGIFTG
jgi:hypothetical protein